jgi:hypothetical protein
LRKPGRRDDNSQAQEEVLAACHDSSIASMKGQRGAFVELLRSPRGRINGCTLIFVEERGQR